MKIATFALTITVLGGVTLVGCNSSSEGDTAPTAAPGATVAAAPGAGGMQAPGNPMAPGIAPKPGGGGVSAMGGGKGGRQSSFDSAPESMKKLWGAGGGGMAPMSMPGAGGGMGGGDAAGAKPAPIREGMVALASRKDPFESIFKQVVQITPAWDYVINHRTEAPPKYVPPTTLTGDPDIDLPPLPPVARRIAGVFYNGGITAILESGNPPDSDITIVQPGAEVESGIPNIPPLVVESITMDNLILRARDGRTVEVKLSSLAPAVRDALRQQFGSTTGSGMGMGPGGMGSGSMGPGGMGPGGFGGRGPGGIGGGAKGSGGGSGAPIQ